MDGSNYVSGTSQPALLLLLAGDPKIQQLGHAVRLDDDVRGFYITMDDIVAMGIGKGRAHLLDNLQPGN